MLLSKKTPKFTPKRPRELLNNGLSPLLTWMLFGVMASSLFINFLLLVRGDPTKHQIYIQTPDGQAVAATKVDPLHRTDETVTSFAQDWLTLILTWNGKGDEGLIAFNQKIPTNLYKLSWALDPDIVNPVVKSWVTSFNSSLYVNTNKKAMKYRVRGIPKLVDSGNGEWTMDIYGDRLIFTQGSQAYSAPYNVRLTIKAVSPQPFPLPEEADPIDELIYENQKTGLMITNVEDLGAI